MKNFLKHPLTLLFVGFILTCGAGLFITYQINKIQRESDEVKAKREHNFETVTKITELMYRRYTASTLFASSFFRQGTIDELKDRKRLYDDSYLQWNSNIECMHLQARNLYSDIEYDSADTDFDSLTAAFCTIDAQLTTGYDKRINKNSWRFDLDDSIYLKNSLYHAQDLCYSISDSLFCKINQ